MNSRSYVQPTWVGDVLHFWFEELTPGQWFRKDAEVDRTIIARFGDVHTRVATAIPATLLADAATALASIITLDQFSRNIYRASARAFAQDAQALTLATASIAKGFDVAVPVERRLFFYLPFEHAEDRVHQQHSVAMITALGNEKYTAYALAHQAIIERFGRYPHRNAMLGRTSTAEELEFLQEPGSSF